MHLEFWEAFFKVIKISLGKVFGGAMNFIKTLLAIAIISLPLEVFAEEDIDIKKNTCGELLESTSDDERNLVITWLLGYVNGKTNSTVISVDFYNQLNSYCAGHSKDSLLKATNIAAKKTEASSQDRDLNKYTCKDMNHFEEDLKGLVAWFTGYITAVNNKTSLSGQLEKTYEKLSNLCDD